MPCASDAYGRMLYPSEWPALVHGFFTQGIEEHAPRPLYLWPERARMLIAHNQHLTWPDRFYLTTFLLANGVSPLHIVLWYLLRGCLRDEGAAVHVRGILSGWMRGELHMYIVWDMNEGDGAGKKVHPPGPGGCTFIPAPSPSFMSHTVYVWSSPFIQAERMPRTSTAASSSRRQPRSRYQSTMCSGETPLARRKVVR